MVQPVGPDSDAGMPKCTGMRNVLCRSAASAASVTVIQFPETVGVDSGSISDIMIILTRTG